MKRLTILFVFLVSLTSCSDFLVEEPRSEQSLDQYFQSPKEARSFVNALYRRGATTFYNPGGFRGSVVMMGGYISGLFDNESKGERIEPLRAQELSFDAVNMAEYLYEWWANSYNAIATANTAIQRVPETVGLSETESNQLQAEARFFRAFNYFFLAKNFGSVPLITEPYTSLEGIYAERAGVEDIYAQIVADLDWAVNEGELADVAFPLNGFKVTRGAAAALLADVHLQMAGYPLQANDSYARAADAAREVINSGAHQLIENGPTPELSAYNVMRTSDVEREYVYSIEYEGSIASNSAPVISVPGHIRPTDIKYNRTQAEYFPMDEYVEIYDLDNDLRIQNRQLFYTSFERDGQLYELGQYAPYLFFEETALFETGRGSMDIKVYRLADVLLIAAEAIARSEGVTTEAVNYLAEVRSRAYWQTDRSEIESELSGLSVQAFVEEVWKERYRELALDYKVWPDIQRTRKYPVANAGEVEFVDVIGHTNPWGATYQETHLLFPISDNELQRNPSLVQNPGY